MSIFFSILLSFENDCISYNWSHFQRSCFLF
uniref:Uncharacterized protein n=1 Tax=Anguilla anguilla TaxID=7936 RepID=A0A0E9R9N7_ANGAN